jgi:glycosyltransferase involved in cell wall biosynthesis
MTPQVTVVMPVRNGARWLREAVESVVSQTLPDWELLAIDDGSTDDTPRILSEFAKATSIRVIRQEPLGLVSALNRGLAEARSPLLARLDADDRALPERLDRQLRHLRAHPDIGLLGSWAQKIDDSGNRRGQLRPATEPEELARILARGNPFVHSSVMFRTELVRRLGGFRPAFRAAEDYDLWLRIAETAKLANLPETLVAHRWHSENVTNRNAIRQSFSVRLAQRSARARRDTGKDPADGLTSPPDWRAPATDASFYADDATLYRLLDLADPEFPGDADDDADFAPLATRFAELNHAERALAARAMINHMRRADRTRARQTRRLFFGLLRQRPGMIPRAAWRALPAALLR